MGVEGGLAGPAGRRGGNAYGGVVVALVALIGLGEDPCAAVVAGGVVELGRGGRPRSGVEVASQDDGGPCVPPGFGLGSQLLRLLLAERGIGPVKVHRAGPVGAVLDIGPHTGDLDRLGLRADGEIEHPAVGDTPLDEDSHSVVGARTDVRPAGQGGRVGTAEAEGCESGEDGVVLRTADLLQEDLVDVPGAGRSLRDDGVDAFLVVVALTVRAGVAADVVADVAQRCGRRGGQGVGAGGGRRDRGGDRQDSRTERGHERGEAFHCWLLWRHGRSAAGGSDGGDVHQPWPISTREPPANAGPE